MLELRGERAGNVLRALQENELSIMNDAAVIYSNIESLDFRSFEFPFDDAAIATDMIAESIFGFNQIRISRDLQCRLALSNLERSARQWTIHDFLENFVANMLRAKLDERNWR